MERLGLGQELPATCRRFIIPKLLENVPMISHFMDFKEVPPPPRHILVVFLGARC